MKNKQRDTLVGKIEAACAIIREVHQELLIDKLTISPGVFAKAQDSQEALCSLLRAVCYIGEQT